MTAPEIGELVRVRGQHWVVGDVHGPDRTVEDVTARTPLDAVEESIFEVVSQLNRAGALINSREERERVAELNLIAGRRAKASTAYASALTHFTIGAALAPGDVWERRRELAFALAFNRAECEFLTGALSEAEARLAELTNRAASLPELATVTRLQVDLFMTLGRSDLAVAAGLDYLRRLGIAWSAHPTKEEVGARVFPTLAAARRTLDRSADRPAPDGGSGRARDD